VGGVHGAVPLWHQGEAPEHPEEQGRDLPHRQSQYPATRGDAQCFSYERGYLRNTNTKIKRLVVEEVGKVPISDSA
jgi:hypothetical protein